MSKDQVIDNNMLKGKGLDDDLLSLGSVEEELIVDYDDVQVSADFVVVRLSFKLCLWVLQ